MRSSGTISLAAGFLWVLATTSCVTYEKWPRTDEFLRRLKCGMSEQEVGRVVSEFPGLEFRDSQRGTPWDKVAIKGRTSIVLDFDESGLRQAKVVWDTGILAAKALPVYDFCSSPAR
jgi:hypothetical protein